MSHGVSNYKQLFTNSCQRYVQQQYPRTVGLLAVVPELGRSASILSGMPYKPTKGLFILTSAYIGNIVICMQRYVHMYIPDTCMYANVHMDLFTERMFAWYF